MFPKIPKYYMYVYNNICTMLPSYLPIIVIDTITYLNILMRFNVFSVIKIRQS